MSAFALPIPPAGLAPRLRRPTERSATTPEDRSQMSEVRCQKTDVRSQNRHEGRTASGQSPDTRPATAAPSPRRYSQGPGNTATTPASRRRSRSPSPQNGGTRASTAAAVQTLRQGWRRSTWTPAEPGRPGQTARSAETRGSPDAPPATADTPAETHQDPHPEQPNSSPSALLISALLISALLTFCPSDL